MCTSQYPINLGHILACKSLKKKTHVTKKQDTTKTNGSDGLAKFLVLVQANKINS